MLSIKVHLVLMIVCEFAGFLAGGIVAIGMWVSGVFGDRLWLAGLACFSTILVGVMVPRTFFRSLLPADCDQQNCNGAAFPTGTNPITYVCRQCGSRAATGISERDTRDHW